MSKGSSFFNPMVVKDFEGSGVDFEVKAVSNSKIIKVIENN